MRNSWWLGVLLLGACSSTPSEEEVKSPEPVKALERVTDDPIYNRLLENFTRGESYFAGLNNTFQFSATILNSAVEEAQINKQAAYAQWTTDKIEKERARVSQESSTNAKVFLSFYVPERKYDNLTSSSSIWRIFLETGESRYEGKVAKVSKLLGELDKLFPTHTRWSTPYMVSFNIPMSQLENRHARLLITGPLGNRMVEFDPLQK